MLLLYFLENSRAPKGQNIFLANYWWQIFENWIGNVDFDFEIIYKKRELCSNAIIQKKK